MSLTHIQYVCYFVIVFLDVKMKELSFVYGYFKILIGFNKTYNISESDLSYEPCCRSQPDYHPTSWRYQIVINCGLRKYEVSYLLFLFIQCIYVVVEGIGLGLN
jgi:hypothetical protein